MQLNGKTLRKIRIAYKLTQAEMGALLGCTASFINKIERGKYPLTDNIRETVMKEFKLTPEKVALLLDEYNRIMLRKAAANRRKAAV